MSSRPHLARGVAATVATSAVTILGGLLAVPIILDQIGLAAYGAWTIAQAAVVYASVAEAGLAPAVQRFVAVAKGAGRVDDVARLLWTSVAAYLLFGLLLVAGCYAFAPSFPGLFDLHGELGEDAEAMFRVTGWIIAAALLGGALGNTLQGLERFVPFSLSAAASVVVFVGGAAILLADDRGLEGLAWAALGQQIVIVVGRAFALRDVFGRSLPRLAHRAQLKELLSFSARLQMNVLSMLVNNQTDRVVVGLVSKPTTTGQLGIGLQFAEALRLVLGSAASPIVSRMSVSHGEGDRPGLDSFYRRTGTTWLLVLVGITAVTLGAIAPLIEAWLGEGHGEAALLGGVLVVAHAVNLLSVPGIAYLRALGQPGLEARYGALTVGLNVALTIGLGIAFGALGVVIATALAYIVGTSWFLGRVRRLAPALDRPHAPWPLVLAVAVLAAGAAGGVGWAAAELLPRGVALIPVGLATVAALAGYLRVAAGVTPTPRRVRALLS